MNRADNNGPTPLVAGCHSVAVVKLLLAAGAGVDGEDTSNGWTPLFTASYYGHAEMVELLLSAGANVNKATYDGSTPLYTASSRGHTKVVKLLLTAGAHVNNADNPGHCTALYAASSFSQVEVVRLLVQAGADANLADKHGWTPLFIASRQGDTEIVKLLLEGVPQIDVNSADEDDQTPLYIAAYNGHAEIVNLLLEVGGAKVDKTDKDGNSPLIIASLQGHAKIVKLLLEAGANMDKVNQYNLTPLYCAAKYGHTKVVQLLGRSCGPIDFSVQQIGVEKPESFPRPHSHASSRFARFVGLFACTHCMMLIVICVISCPLARSYYNFLPFSLLHSSHSVLRSHSLPTLFLHSHSVLHSRPRLYSLFRIPPRHKAFATLPTI